MNRWIWIVLFVTAPSWGRDKVQKLDFEETLVEGMNRKPLDSLNQISEDNQGRKKTYLYRKRAGFKEDNPRLLRQIRRQS